MDRISMITALFARALAIKSIGGDSLSYIGVTTTALSDGATTNPITIDGDTVTATNGNVALYGGDAFVFNGTIWQASSAISQIFTEIGDLSDLDTEVKTDLVSAINEVNEEKQDDVELSLTPTAVVSDRDIIDGQGNTLSVLAEALTKTASGNPVVISDCAGGKARSLITEINAIQDLHGLPFPYVGGAYKNKLPMTVSAIKAANTGGTWSGNVYTINGGTITILTDSDGNVTGFKVNGTFNDAVNFYVTPTNMSLESNGMIYSGITSGSGSTYFLYFDGAGVEVQTSEVTITTGRNPITMARIVIRSGAVLNNVLFYPMVRPSIVTDPTFAPYSNICPISGRTAVVITRSDGDEISEDFTIQLGTTVYGADINWDTGVASITHVLLVNNTADMDNSEDWPGWRTSGIRQYIGGGINRVFTGQTMNVGTVYGANTTGNDDTLILPKDTYNLSQTEWKALSMDVQIAVELATPTTIQLTPEQLGMLKGYNRVTIESGTITLDYIAKAISGNDEEIAPLVGDKATKSYAVNDFIERNDGLYRVTAPIASGASFTANNTVKMSIGEALTYLYNK